MKNYACIFPLLLFLWGCSELPINEKETPQTEKAIGIPNASTLNIAHLTDPHLYDGASKNIDPKREDEGCLNLRLLKNTIDQINEQNDVAPLDLVIVTGDIGVEKLIEATGIMCSKAQISRNQDGKTEFDGVVRDNEIFNALKNGAESFAKLIANSQVSDWLFVNGNNDLCNEDTNTLVYFNHYIDELKKAVAQLNSKINIHNLVSEDDHVATYSSPKAPNHVFIGFENGSWKNNHNALYADGKNKDFQYNTLSSLETEIIHQEKGGKKIHLVFHAPNFDDPYNAASAKNSCEKRIPTNAQFEDNCTKINPKIPSNAPKNLYSAWLVRDDFRTRWDNLTSKPSVKNLLAGHFHSQDRDIYLDPKSGQTQEYKNIEKYAVAPPISIKNQTVEKEKPQARGFSLFTIATDGSKTRSIFWSDQLNNGQCLEINFSPWKAQKSTT